MLNAVKLALRISGTAFDDELNMLITACAAELERFGVNFYGGSTSDDPQIVSTVIAYCKWLFGDRDDKDTWREIYHMKLAQFKTMSGYTDWGE